MPWLVAGLGNPEPRYVGNRHNIGFMVTDELARRAGVTFKKKFKGLLTKARVGARDAWLLEPMTFMNRSGIALGAAGAFYGIEPDETVVVHDELDLPFGVVRVKVGGGHGGHNGLRSIFSHFGRDFIRVRCGIGRPVHGDVTNHVLSDFSTDEKPWLQDIVDAAAEAVASVLNDGPIEAMSAFNGRAIVAQDHS